MIRRPQALFVIVLAILVLGIAPYVVAKSVEYKRMRMLKPITKSTVKDIKGPDDIGPADIKQIMPAHGEGRGYYLEKYRRRLPNKQGHAIEFYGLTLIDLNYRQMMEFALSLSEWLAVTKLHDKDEVNQRIQNLTEIFPNLTALFKGITAPQWHVSTETQGDHEKVTLILGGTIDRIVADVQEMGGYQKVAAVVTVDRFKLAKRYPQLKFALDNSIHYMQATGSDQYGDQAIQVTIMNSNQVKVEFLKDKYGCILSADQDWRPAVYPDNPTKIKKYHWRWLPKDFECRLNVAVRLDANLFFVNIFHLDMPKLAVRINLKQRPEVVEGYAEAVDVQIKSAKLGGIESSLLKRAGLSQKNNLKARGSMWTKSLDGKDYMIFRAQASSLIPDHWLVNLVMRDFEGFGFRMLKDFVKPWMDVYTAARKDLEHIQKMPEAERIRRGIRWDPNAIEEVPPPPEINL